MITVTATANSKSGSIEIPVVGTTLTLAGNSALLLSNTPAPLTARALDSAGAPIANAILAVKSALGNPLSPASVTTDASGYASIAYTPANSGTDTVTLTGLGAQAQLRISVSGQGQDFSFVKPTSGATVAIDVDTDMTVHLLSSGVGVANQVVTFSTTRGSVTPTQATTDANGVATVKLRSTTAGPATLTARQGTTLTATQQIEFVATEPATLILQANPNAVAPNVAGSSANRVTLQALVRDVNGNPVKDAIVNFAASKDLSGGTINPASGITNSNGTVEANFIPGTLSTAANGVELYAFVASNPSVTGTTTLTVSTKALFISIATGNEITNRDTNTYSKPFTLYVTDANGAAVGNQAIVLSVYMDYYGKGALAYDGSQWHYASLTQCVNEDANRNGFLDPGEDNPPPGNSDGHLTPGGVVLIASDATTGTTTGLSGTVTTDSDGFATFSLLYGEQYANWGLTTINARASVSGTESTSAYNYTLAASAEDMKSDVPPASAVSPFGVSTDCTNPN
ncbi:Ig-like domain-containing protein [Ramlibacter sp. H39-3-26]|nr:Ig-like domain-containing protein [Ramlibacter sp. H39-3-26]MDF1483765.1 Ig-like domain-containing protein [Ramlibacter sp. H39-3-26]